VLLSPCGPHTLLASMGWSGEDTLRWDSFVCLIWSVGSSDSRQSPNEGQTLSIAGLSDFLATSFLLKLWLCHHVRKKSCTLRNGVVAEGRKEGRLTREKICHKNLIKLCATPKSCCHIALIIIQKLQVSIFEIILKIGRSFPKV